MRRFWVFLALVIPGFVGRVSAQTNLPSTSVQLDDRAIVEAVKDLAQYENVPQLSGKLTSAGSGTGTAMLNHWASEFVTLYPEVELDIRGGGATTNVLAAFIEGKIDLVPLSRPLPLETAAAFKAKYSYDPSQIVVGPDALGIYVNKNNPVSGLTMAQLEAIYSRTPTNGNQHVEFWSDLGVPLPLGAEPVERYCLVKRHGAYSFFKQAVLKGAEYRFSVRFEEIHSSLVQAVGAEEAGIAFDSIQFATARTRFVPIQAADGQFLAPTYDNVISGKYPLVRPILVVFNRKPDGQLKPVVREFLRFAVSRRGQRVNAMDGGFPLTAAQQRQALETIGNAP